MYNSWPRTIIQADTKPMTGVNLGGWLVLEKWITPRLFDGFKAIDEYTLCEQGGDVIKDRLQAHRLSYITKQDFIWLAEHGIEAIRLPISYGVFGDGDPFYETISYVDKAFDWAEATGIKILLDMHAAPGSQNGWDHSGRAGTMAWHKNPENIQQTLSVIERLAVRYAKCQALLGIELLNEPKFSLPKRPMKRYYQAAYTVIRKHCGQDVWVVISDHFVPIRWQHELLAPKYVNVIVDAHKYQAFQPWDKWLTLAGHFHKLLGPIPAQLQRMRRAHPIIVGEWSLALNGRSTGTLSAEQSDYVNRAYGAAQLLAFSQCRAWFFWTYKTDGGGAWSLRDCISHGWLPPMTPVVPRK